MPTVTDTFTAGGYQWRAAFTDATAARSGGLLERLSRLAPAKAVGRLRDRGRELGELLWLACEGEAEARGLSQERFFAQLSYATIPAAVVAALAAIAVRFPHSRLARGLRNFQQHG